jgi:hypothetical protein
MMAALIAVNCQVRIQSLHTDSTDMILQTLTLGCERKDSSIVAYERWW